MSKFFKYWMLLLGWCLLSVHALAESKPPDTLRLDSLYWLPANLQVMAADDFKTLYCLNPQGELLQIDSVGKDMRYRYSNNRLGIPDLVDVSVPLRPLLFYRDYQTVVLLDRTLTEIQQINLSAWNVGWILSIAGAQDGGFWLFDQSDFSMKKISTRSGQLQYQGQNLSSLLGHPVQPTKILETGGRIYAWNSDVLYVFDNFAQFIEEKPFEGTFDFWFLRDQIVLANQVGITFLNRSFLEINALVWPEILNSNTPSVFLSKGLAVFSPSENSTIVYRLQFRE